MEIILGKKILFALNMPHNFSIKSNKGQEKTTKSTLQVHADFFTNPNQYLLELLLNRMM